MGLFGKKEETLPVHSSPEDVQHRDVLPAGKPKGVAEHNGTTFKKAGVTPSDYREEEYDVEATFEQASRERNREVFGSVSSGSTDQSSASEGGDDANKGSMVEKMKDGMKKPLLK